MEGIRRTVSRTSATSLRYIVGPSLPELQVKLVMKLGTEGSEAG